MNHGFGNCAGKFADRIIVGLVDLPVLYFKIVGPLFEINWLKLTAILSWDGLFGQEIMCNNCMHQTRLVANRAESLIGLPLEHRSRRPHGQPPL